MSLRVNGIERVGQFLPAKPTNRDQTSAHQALAEDGSAKKAEFSEIGNMHRFKVELNYISAIAPPVYGPYPPGIAAATHEEAQRAAREVEKAYFDCSDNGISNSTAATKKLRELTDRQSPAVAALTLKYAKATIERIAADLGATSKQEDAGFGDDKPRFDNVVSDLAAVVARAAASPGGKAVAQQIARSLVNNIDKNDIGRFDEAFGKTIANGSGAELAAAVVKELQAACRTAQADNVLHAATEGIRQLRTRAAEIQKTVGEHNQKLAWLIKQWQPMMSKEQLEKAVQAYKNKFPDYQKALAQADQLAVSIVRAAGSFGQAQNNFSGLAQAGNVDNAFKDLFSDPNVKSALAQSTAITDEIEHQIEIAENNPGGESFFNKIAEITGKVDDGKFLTEVVFNKALDAKIDKSLQAAKNGDYKEVARQLATLQKHAAELGFDDPKLQNVLTQLGTANAKISQAIARGEDPLKAARNTLHILSQKIDSLEHSEPQIFSNQSQFSEKFKRFGLLLGAVGVAGATNEAVNDSSAKNIASALTDAIGLSIEAAETKLVTNVLQNKDWFKGLPLEAAGKVFGALGLVFDVYGVAEKLEKGEIADAGFGAASTVGGAMMIFGGAAATGVGAIIIGASLLGKIWHDRVQHSNINENDGSKAFLEGIGISPELAEQLINNDDEGRSAAPVFTGLAEKLGVDPKQFFAYLAQLSTEKAEQLIKIAHGVDPDEQGVFSDTKKNPTYYSSDGVYVDKAPNDLNDLVEWMKENGYSDAPGVSS